MENVICWILITIDGAIYDFFCYLYDIFNYLAKLNVFAESDYQTIVNRIYIILGLIMLFILAYSLLRAVINPDEFAKGETSFPNLIKNVLISLIIIVLLPTAFTVAFNIQNSILNNDVIPKLILDDYNLNEQNQNTGRLIAFYTFQAFLFPNIDYCESLGFDDINVCRLSASDLKGNWGWGQWGDHISTTDVAVLNHNRSFKLYCNYSEVVSKGKMEYSYIISTVAAIFMTWVMANFCFDMAIRVIKLAFYQIIAPIPVICRIIPGGKMKDVFSSWTKQVISLFVEVFIRIGAMTLCGYLVDIIVKKYTSTGFANSHSLTWGQEKIVVALLIMGTVIFVKQIPKILGDILKLDTGGMKLGLMDKLAMGGGLLAGAAVGGLATSGVRNLVSGGRNMISNTKNAEGFRGKAKAIAKGSLGTLTSGVAGAISGGVRAGYGARSAKNFNDVKGAASKGAAGATAARTKRQANIARYKAQGGNKFTKTALGGHIVDFGKSVQDWATGGIGQYDEKIKISNDLKSAGDSIFDEVDKILTKNANNADMVANMTSFKGDPNGDLMDLYQSYSGMSLAAIEADINRQGNIVDFSQFVDRNAFERIELDPLTMERRTVFDAKGYQDAIDREARKHASKMANLRSMYSQLEKETKKKIINAAMNSNMEIDGIGDDKLQVIRDKVNVFNEKYSQVGGTVVDPVTKHQYKEISKSGDIAEEIDKITTAFANMGSEASANAAKHRQAMDARNGK